MTNQGAVGYYRHLRWGLRSRVAVYPSLYISVARRKYGDAVLADDTGFLIDGFTRSGVTFAVVAFNVAQRTPVSLAHTLHAPAHIIAAVRRKVPSLVTIREPEAAVLSAVIREPNVTIEQGLRAWIRFYSAIRPYRQGFVVGPFDRVVDDFGSVIREVNDRFGTAFDQFDHTPENVALCFSIIEDRSRRPPWAVALGKFESGRLGLAGYLAAREEYKGNGQLAKVPETRVPRPSAERDAMKRRLTERLSDPGLRELRREAQRLFEDYVGPVPSRGPDPRFELG
ncbi:MAG TPA: hypothetical protein VEM41_10290 [Actinomycetota bacterium]|nr:hypothetical protein [Actinomycetota bacterium]